MLLSSSMPMVAGVAPLHTLLRSESFDVRPESERPQRPRPRQRRMPRYTSAADASLQLWSVKPVSDAGLSPTKGEARGNLRDIWEDTRLEAMQRLLVWATVEGEFA